MNYEEGVHVCGQFAVNAKTKMWDYTTKWEKFKVYLLKIRLVPFILQLS